MSSRSEGPSKRLPARSSRGTRINKLIGEAAEADEAFWGQDVWREDGDDEDYSTEEEEEDVVDSDFDEEEAPDEDVHDGEEDEKRPQRRRTRTKERKDVSIPSVTRKRRLDQPEEKPAKRNEPSGSFELPNLRHSTAVKSTRAEENRRRQSEETASRIKKKPPPSKPEVRLTQAELLAEAVQTEVENTQSLSRLEQLEEERKEEAIQPKQPMQGQSIRTYSRIDGPKLVTFVNSSDFPSLFNQSQPKKPSTKGRVRRLDGSEPRAPEHYTDSEEEEPRKTT